MAIDGTATVGSKKINGGKCALQSILEVILGSFVGILMYLP